MSFPRYQRYKDSGVEWLGEVPEHWQVRSFRHSARIKNGNDFKHIEVEDGGCPVVGSGGPFARVSQFMYDRPSVLLGRKGTIDKPLYMDCPFWAVDTMYYTEIASDSIPKYVFYYSKCIPFDLFTYGSALPSMTQTTLHALDMPLPNLQDQAQIVLFLDDETAKINALIEEQRRLIELLKEKRQAVISHAVTKGLDPGAPMKDSGTFWIGEIPQHWDVSSLRYFARFSSGSTPDRTTERYWGGDIPWVKTGEIDYAVINDTEEMITAEGMAESSVTLVPAGSMLLALYGQGVTRGRVAMLGVAATFNQACVAIESDERIDRAYLFAFFVFAYRFIREIGNETTQMNLNLDFVKAIRVPLPPLPEQRSIAEAVASHMSSSDSLTGEAMKAIELLQERRSALISAAVTGKIDVRSYNPKEAA